MVSNNYCYFAIRFCKILEQRKARHTHVKSFLEKSLKVSFFNSNIGLYH